MTKKDYDIKKKPNIDNAYRVSATIKGNNNKDFLKKKMKLLIYLKGRKQI